MVDIEKKSILLQGTTPTQKRILLVEDEPLIALAETKMLERAGYACVITYSGEQAVERIQGQEVFDLVLMDINLGTGMDGTEAAQKILAIRNLPLVFLSCHTDPEIVNKTEGITGYGYIVKTSGETVILASIRMALKLWEAHKEILFVSEVFRVLAGMNCQAGEGALRYLVRYLATICQSRYALISLVNKDDPYMARTVAVWDGSDFGENFTYDLRGSPCARVLEEEECFVENDADIRFPEDRLLKEMRIKSYWGVWIKNEAGAPVGVLAILDTKPLKRHPWTRDILEIVSRRVAAEIDVLFP